MYDFVQIGVVKKTMKLLIRKTAAEGSFGFEKVVSKVTENIQIFSRVVRPGAALILSKFDIQYPVEFVLYGPMTAFGVHDLAGRHALSTVDKIVGLLGSLPILLYFAEYHSNSSQIAPFLPPVQPSNIFGNIAGAAFITSMSLTIAFRAAFR